MKIENDFEGAVRENKDVRDDFADFVPLNRSLLNFRVLGKRLKFLRPMQVGN